MYIAYCLMIKAFEHLHTIVRLVSVCTRHTSTSHTALVRFKGHNMHTGCGKNVPELDYCAETYFKPAKKFIKSAT